MRYRLACPITTPHRGRRPRYDQAIEYALSLPKSRCVWVILDPLIERMGDRFRYGHSRFRFEGRDHADSHIMTAPHEKIRFVYPIRSSSIHNLKVAIYRRIRRLGLSDKLRAEVRKGKVLIFRV